MHQQPQLSQLQLQSATEHLSYNDCSDANEEITMVQQLFIVPWDSLFAFPRSKCWYKCGAFHRYPVVEFVAQIPFLLSTSSFNRLSFDKLPYNV